MVWGKKKPTEFDQAQDKQLQQLMANQKVLITNNSWFIEQNKNLWSWINYLEKHVKTLKSTIVAMKARDEEFAKMFSGLASLSQAKAEAETVTEETT